MRYYTLDLLVGYFAPVLVYVLVRTGRVEPIVWRLFWAGAAIGLTWEIPMFVGSAETTAWASLRWVQPLPTHYGIFLISHTLWDGGLFLVGVWLAQRFCQPSWWTRFDPKAMAIMLAWGQLSALAVEMSSTYNNGWAFIAGYAWNPTLFEFNGHAVTLLPQAVWLAAPVVYYLVLLRLARATTVRSPDQTD